MTFFWGQLWHHVDVKIYIFALWDFYIPILLFWDESIELYSFDVPVISKFHTFLAYRQIFFIRNSKSKIGNFDRSLTTIKKLWKKSDNKFHDPENYVKKLHDPEKDAENFHDPENPLRPGVNIKSDPKGGKYEK